MASVEPDDIFRHRQLTEPGAIRLLLIQPSSSREALIQCTLIHTTLDECEVDIIEQYVALSYVWGDPTLQLEIQLDGHKKLIGQALEAALRDLRDSSRAVRLWADALCINQADNDEKNVQVRQMGRIYSTANHTVIHLGSLTSEVEYVLRTARSRDVSEANKAIEMARSSLLARPWFRRVWIFQELVLSPDPWVQCSNVRVRWRDLCDLLVPNLLSGGTLNSNRRITDGLQILQVMQSAKAHRVPMALTHLLLLRRGLEATDSRDMIFAHMGTATDQDLVARDVTVDYNKSLGQVFTDVARYFLKASNLEILFFHTDNVSHGTRHPNVPSWAPDWTLPPSYLVPMFNNQMLNTKMLKDVHAYYTFVDDLPVLACMGYETEVIDQVSLTLPDKMPASPQMDIYQQTVTDLEAIYGRAGGSYATGDKYGRHTRISLRGQEEEHARLCRLLYEQWIQILGEQLPAASQPPASPIEKECNAAFLSVFRQWAGAESCRDTITVGFDSDCLRKLMYDYMHPSSDAPILVGRRLASTRSGNIAIVPSQAHTGDLVAFFAGSETSILLREKLLDDTISIDERIYDSFMEKDQDPGARQSSYIPSSFTDLFAEKEVLIRHYEVVGECYVEGSVPFAVGEQQDHKIFALH